MNNSVPEPVPLPPVAPRTSFWSAHRRRPAFLLLLVIGLVLFLIWLPGGARASLWTALSAQRGLVVLLFLFALVTLSLIWSAGQRLDTRIFTLLNTRGYPIWLDRFMWLTTQLGNMLTAFIVAFLLFILNYRRLAIEIIFGTLTLWLLVEIIKALSDRDRPFLTLDKARVIGWREKGDSFPSGHTTQIFFLMTLFIHYFQLGLGASIALYAVAAPGWFHTDLRWRALSKRCHRRCCAWISLGDSRHSGGSLLACTALLKEPPPSGGEQTLPGRWMWPGSVCCRMSSDVMQVYGLSVPDLATGGITQTTIHNHRTEQIAQKEKSHVVDYHRNSGGTVAARFLGWEYKPKLPAYRQLDPHSDRHRGHPGCFETVGNRLDPRFVEIRRGSRQAALSFYFAGIMLIPSQERRTS